MNSTSTKIIWAVLVLQATLIAVGTLMLFLINA